MQAPPPSLAAENLACRRGERLLFRSLSFVLTPGAADLATLETLWRESRAARIDRAARPAVEAAAARVAQAAGGATAVYGVNTGFGKLASRRIAARRAQTASMAAWSSREG